MTTSKEYRRIKGIIHKAHIKDKPVDHNLAILLIHIMDDQIIDMNNLKTELKLKIQDINNIIDDILT